MTENQLPSGLIFDDAVAAGHIYLPSLRLKRTAPAFAAAPIADPSVATIWEPGIATAGVTWGVPTNPFTGGILILVTTQDTVGGRAVAYNAVFKTAGGAAISTTLSTKNIDVFYYDGTNWRLFSRLTGQTI
jgi:hypothetical protein